MWILLWHLTSHLKLQILVSTSGKRQTRYININTRNTIKDGVLIVAQCEQKEKGRVFFLVPSVHELGRFSLTSGSFSTTSKVFLSHGRAWLGIMLIHTENL